MSAFTDRLYREWIGREKRREGAPPAGERPAVRESELVRSERLRREWLEDARALAARSPGAGAKRKEGAKPPAERSPN